MIDFRDCAYELELDLADYGFYPKINMKQYDVKSRFIKARLYNDGLDFNVNDKDLSFKIIFKKPDGKVVFKDCTVVSDGQDKYVLIPVNANTLAVDGIITSELVIMQKDEIFSSKFFYINCLPSLHADKNIIESNDEYDGFLESINKVEELLKELEDLNTIVALHHVINVNQNTKTISFANWQDYPQDSYVEVYISGVKQIEGVDFNLDTNAKSITMIDPKTFMVGDQVLLCTYRRMVGAEQQLSITADKIGLVNNIQGANNVQDALETINKEVVDARVEESGTQHTTLGNRLNNIDKKIKNTSMPTISFCFDDGFSEDNLTYSIFKEYDMTCSFALITEYSLQRNRLEYYRQYEREGFSVNSHSCTHLYLGDGTVAENIANYEIAESKNHMNLWGFAANGFVAGQSVVHDRYINLLRNNYDFAFTQYWGTLSDTNKGYCDSKTDRYKLGRVSLFRNDTTKIKEAIDNCIKDNGCLFFYDHQTGAAGDHISEAKLREVLQYVKTKVDNKECVVRNNDDAISSYFGISLENRKLSKLSDNMASKLDVISPALEFNSWWLSKHANDLLETYTTETINNEIVGKIHYANGARLNKENSLQTKIDVSNIDFTKHRNQTVVLSLDMWTDKDVNLEVYLDSRFYKGTTFDVTHREKMNLTTKRQTFSIVVSPYRKQMYDYLLVYPRIKVLSDINEAFNVYVANPVISINNDISNVNPTQHSGLLNTLKRGLAYTKTLNENAAIGNRAWSKYSMTGVGQIYDGIDDGSGTLKMKYDGLYAISFEGYYRLDNVRIGSRALARVLRTNDMGIENNYRTIGYIQGTSGVINFNTTFIVQCYRNDIINAEVFLDSVTGTMTELERARIRVELIEEGIK